MKHALVLLALILGGCGVKPAYRRPAPTITPQWMPVRVQAGSIAPPDADGKSKTEFSVPLNTDFDHKLLLLEFRFNTANFSTLTVSTPEIAAAGCKIQPEIHRPKNSDGTPHSNISVSKTKLSSAKDEVSGFYEKPIELDANAERVLTLEFNVDKSCTNVHGNFAVQFK